MIIVSREANAWGQCVTHGVKVPWQLLHSTGALVLAALRPVYLSAHTLAKAEKSGPNA